MRYCDGLIVTLDVSTESTTHQALICSRTMLGCLVSENEERNEHENRQNRTQNKPAYPTCTLEAP
jgi:hypothetical protein